MVGFLRIPGLDAQSRAEKPAGLVGRERRSATGRFGLAFAAAAVGVSGLLGCAADTGSESREATGGVDETTGGVSTSTGGDQPGSGGLDGTGGATGGVQSDTGGAPATGGNPPASGGLDQATGGTPPASGGVGPSSGGVDPGSGGTSSGGVVAGSGGISTGGADPGSGGVSTGGVDPGSGGVDPGTGGEGTGGAPADDPATRAAIEACMLQLPWGAPDLTEEERAPIITAIINTCAAFAPEGDEWQQWCQMFLVAAINKESSYNTHANDTGNDPSTGLLQIRFSSTVVDFADQGPIETLERIGCDFGTVTEDDSFATKRDMMLDVTCNIAIGAWYYFIFGSGNGGSDAVWVWQYCSGQGEAGSLHIGMACHLMGAEAAHSSLSGADDYYNTIKSWFDPCVTYSGTHPFERPLAPERRKYCD